MSKSIILTSEDRYRRVGGVLVDLRMMLDVVDGGTITVDGGELDVDIMNSRWSTYRSEGQQL